MPLIRQLLAFNAYSEGWGLYAEQLADELGAYENDPVGRLGYLQSLAFRACRLVVDTGIHAKSWTREQGVQFFVDVNGSNPAGSGQRGRSLLLMAGAGVRLQSGAQRDQPATREGDDGARREVRRESVQRYGGARRQRAARRAGRERRGAYPDGREVMRSIPMPNRSAIDVNYRPTLDGRRARASARTALA